MDKSTALRIGNKLVDAGIEAVSAYNKSTEKPDRLYHFTDCQGLVGILTSRCLWASLATSLNDDSEIRYGLEYAECRLRAGRIEGPDDRFLSKVADYLDPLNALTGGLLEFSKVYVISFCAHIDRSVHWLHYGRSGTGCAIGFDTREITPQTFNPVPVIYKKAMQDQFIDSIVKKVWSVVRRYKLDAEDSDGNKYLYEMAADCAAACIRLGAPVLKDKAFESEDEWRIIKFDLDEKINHLDPEPSRIKFRASGGRVVPYLEVPLDGVPITELVLGFSFSMSEKDLAIKILLQKTVEGDPTVNRSPVPVRP